MKRKRTDAGGDVKIESKHQIILLISNIK